MCLFFGIRGGLIGLVAGTISFLFLPGTSVISQAIATPFRLSYHVLSRLFAGNEDMTGFFLFPLLAFIVVGFTVGCIVGASKNRVQLQQINTAMRAKERH